MRILVAICMVVFAQLALAVEWTTAYSNELPPVASAVSFEVGSPTTVEPVEWLRPSLATVDAVEFELPTFAQVDAVEWSLPVLIPVEAVTFELPTLPMSAAIPDMYEYAPFLAFGLNEMGPRPAMFSATARELERFEALAKELPADDASVVAEANKYRNARTLANERAMRFKEKRSVVRR